MLCLSSLQQLDCIRKMSSSEPSSGCSAKALRCLCDSLLRCFHYQRGRGGGHHRGLSCLQHLVYHRCVWLLRGPGMLWQKWSLLLHVWCFYHQGHSFIDCNCALNSLGEFTILIIQKIFFLNMQLQYTKYANFFDYHSENILHLKLKKYPLVFCLVKMQFRSNEKWSICAS